LLYNKQKGAIMNIHSYTFQSPYPSPIQTGKPVPETEPQEQTQISQGETLKTPTQQKVESYESSMKSSQSVNVANSTNQSAVSSSLTEFTRINTQLQAEQAYAL
jgi:hypothetical protein